MTGAMLSLKEIARMSEDAGLRVPPSLVTNVPCNSHKTYSKPKKRPECAHRKIFRDVCPDGKWNFIAAPCDSWLCDECFRWRWETELLPEVENALDWARERGVTLKHVVLTWKRGDLGSEWTKEGAKRRLLDLQHLVQWQRRKHGGMEYLKVVESGKQGHLPHLHLLAMCDFIDQRELSKAWKCVTRGSSPIVHVNAAYVKCPMCWPGKGASEGRKAKSHIVPPPGKGYCENCGHRPDWGLDGELLAKSIGMEIVKYLSKELGGTLVSDRGRIKKLSRSKGWAARCKVKVQSDDDVEKSRRCPCGEKHHISFVGSVERLVNSGFGGVEDIPRDNQAAYYPKGGEPCECWGPDTIWLESTARSWVYGLSDFQGPSWRDFERMGWVPDPGGGFQ